jgi:hypothetical protein
VPVRVIFRCEFCDAVPDALTQKALEAQLQELLFGTYLDAQPGNWLVWTGNGLYGRARYACGEHRGELKADLREAYGTLGWHPWAMGPHPVAEYRRGRVQARRRLAPGWSSRWSPTA